MLTYVDFIEMLSISVKNIGRSMAITDYKKPSVS
jgi:hypothetical protein